METIIPVTNNPVEETTSATTPETNTKKKNSKTGRPPAEFTPEERHSITELAKLGIRHTILGKVFNKDPKTIRKYCAEELTKGAFEADKEALITLHKMATSGTCASATIFWAKTRCGYGGPNGLQPADDIEAAKKKAAEKLALAAKTPKNIDPQSDRSYPDGAVGYEFSVYNNDGEPNAEY